MDEHPVLEANLVATFIWLCWLPAMAAWTVGLAILPIILLTCIMISTGIESKMSFITLVVTSLIAASSPAGTIGYKVTHFIGYGWLDKLSPLAQKIEGPLLGYTSTATLTGGGLFGFIKFMVSVGIMFGLIIVNYLFFGVLKSFTLFIIWILITFIFYEIAASGLDEYAEGFIKFGFYMLIPFTYTVIMLKDFPKLSLIYCWYKYKKGEL